MSDNLQHTGVKGMKWGVRKDKLRSSRKLSDEELRTRVKRLSLEQQYRNLNPSTIQYGERFVSTTVGMTITGLAVMASAAAVKTIASVVSGG
jgi:hypothetical protein